MGGQSRPAADCHESAAVGSVSPAGVLVAEVLCCRVLCVAHQHVDDVQESTLEIAKQLFAAPAAAAALGANSCWATERCTVDDAGLSSAMLPKLRAPRFAQTSPLISLYAGACLNTVSLLFQ